MGINEPAFKRRLRDIGTARDGLHEMGVAYDSVETCEYEVQQAKRNLDHANRRLQERREEFDALREKTLEFCPALAEGFGGTALTETVGIVDGRVTVVPIESAKRTGGDMAEVRSLPATSG